MRAPDARVLDPPLLCCFTCYWFTPLTLLSQFDSTDIFLCLLSLKSLVSGTDIVLSLYSPDNHYIPMLFTLFGNVSNTDILILCLISIILYIYRHIVNIFWHSLHIFLSRYIVMFRFSSIYFRYQPLVHFFYIQYGYRFVVYV